MCVWPSIPALCLRSSQRTSPLELLPHDFAAPGTYPARLADIGPSRLCDVKGWEAYRPYAAVDPLRGCGGKSAVLVSGSMGAEKRAYQLHIFQLVSPVWCRKVVAPRPIPLHASALTYNSVWRAGENGGRLIPDFVRRVEYRYRAETGSLPPLSPRPNSHIIHPTSTSFNTANHTTYIYHIHNARLHRTACASRRPEVAAQQCCVLVVPRPGAPLPRIPNRRRLLLDHLLR